VKINAWANPLNMKESTVTQTKEASVSDTTIKVSPANVPINSDTVSVAAPVPSVQASPSRNPSNGSSKSYNPSESLPITNNMPGASVSQGSKESQDNHQHRESPNSGPVHSPANMNQSPQMSLRKPVTPQTTGSYIYIYIYTYIYLFIY
jgi:hypothetical protein